MGTNYYLRDLIQEVEDVLDDNQDYTQGLFHIGKSSSGWCFALHLIPEKGINNLDGWKKLFDSPGTIIRDEYGKVLSKEEMLSIITERSWPNREKSKLQSTYKDWNDFHYRNHSERGPRGLLRHKLDPQKEHCIGHGEGTWDLIIGEFS